MNGEKIGYYRPPVYAKPPVQHGVRNLESIIQEIRTSIELKEICSRIRAIEDKSQQNIIKNAELPYITPHGTCQPSRGEDYFQAHSGICHFDVDHLDDVGPEKAKLIADPHVVFVFNSPGGHGLKFGTFTDAVDLATHDLIWDQQAQYFRATYGIKIDTAPRNVAGACFMSSDPGAYYNPKAQVMACLASATPKTTESKALPPDISDLNPRDLGSRWEFDCPKCGRPKCFLYKTGTTMICSHRNSCGFTQRIAGAEDFHLSDDGNAQRFIMLHGPELLFCHGKRKRWYAWDGIRFQEDRTGKVHYMARDVAHHIKAEADAMPQEASTQDRRKRTYSFSIQTENHNKRKAFVELAAFDPQVAMTPEMLDRDPWLLCVRNGYLNLETGKLEPADPERLVTRQAAVTFNPAATCPKWLTLLDKVTRGNHAMVDFIQQVTGYLLTGETREDKFFLFIGDGANGKSTVLETISAILGDYAVTPPPGTFLERKFNNPSSASPELAMLPGARLATMSETDQGDKVALGLLKRLAAGGKGSARDMYAGLESDTPTVKIIIDSNHPPRITSNDFGTWRRVVRIPFNYRFQGTELIPEFRAKMIRDEYGEHSGILNWMLEGCLKWQQAGRLTLPVEVESATATYRKTEDPVTRFLDDCTTIGDGMATRAGDLYTTFRKWTETNGERCDLSNVKFADEIKTRGFRKTKTMHGASYMGLGLNEAAGGVF